MKNVCGLVPRTRLLGHHFFIGTFFEKKKQAAQYLHKHDYNKKPVVALEVGVVGIE